MIITCHSCTKRYIIDAKSIGSKGRSVRCVACGHAWKQDPVAEPIAEFFPEGVADASARTAHKTTGKRGYRGWAFFCLSVVSVIIVGIFAREPIIKVWPRSAIIYANIGLPVELSGAGLSLADMQVIPFEKNDKKYLIVKGSLENSSDAVRYIPPLMMRVWGDCSSLSWWKKLWFKIKRQSRNQSNQCVVTQWHHTLSRNRLFPGESSQFESPSHEIPAAVTDVTVSF